MTDKEKAKAYDEAIERVKKLYGNGITEEIFPELKEDDTERIRKNCIHFLELQKQHHAATFEIEECIDWLEKQGEQASAKTNERAWLYLVSDVLTWQDGIGQYLDDPRVQELAKRLCKEYEQKLYNPSNIGKNEQKSVYKIEPKFKVGDWVVDNCGYVWKIKGIVNQFYILESVEGDKSCPTIDWVDKTFHLWTIQNAKDGDVLVNGSNIFIFHFINNRRLMGYCHVNMDDGHFYNDIGRNECFCTIDAPVTPSTKEQRDLLFQKMKEAGYKWTTKTNTFEKLVEPKFDPNTLKPFDKVLVKQCDIWYPDFYSCYIEDDDSHVCSGLKDYYFCIPYNDDTKHLAGTKDEAPEYYRYWED